jgi:hypothetical protein
LRCYHLQAIQSVWDVEKLEKPKKVLVNELNSTEEAKPEVVGKLEAEANFEAKLMFHHDSRKVMLITYMINKHKMDTKFLSRDLKNHNEETIAKLMGMATYFISIPEYYAHTAKGLTWRLQIRKMRRKKMKTSWAEQSHTRDFLWVLP